MKVLCIGEALIDMICTDVNVSLSNGQQFLKKAGGAPANVAAAIAALGGDVSMAAKVGDDPFGLHLTSLLKEMGVNTNLIIKDPTHFTTFAFVSLMNDGERDFYFNRGADKELTIADLAALNLKEYSIVHFGSATAFLPGPLQSTYIELLATAIQAGCLISFDPNYRHLLFQNNSSYFITQCMPFIERCNFFKLSDEEAFLITGFDTVTLAANALRKKTKAVFTITLGKEGTLLSLGEQIEIIKSIPIQPVDATGAGDAFVGAVLYQLNTLNNLDINKLTIENWKLIISNANKAGARTCEYMGAMEAFQHLNNSIFD
ncbi:MAG: carbohydrate kinase [Chitinophagia bacterium]|jgi:fructokinase|nr:carbohydrate kinase [Chitinophagia bacterium]NCA29126.1 carbohydrate kinase [Chitinophagia bacterium]NDD16969.1 carbohydrate kinase [Chitinophagia bacterium]